MPLRGRNLTKGIIQLLFTGNDIEGVKSHNFWLDSADHFGPSYCVVNGNKGRFEISVDPDKFLKDVPINYSPADTVEISNWDEGFRYVGIGSKYESLFMTEEKSFRIWLMPNLKLDPHYFQFRLYKDGLINVSESYEITSEVTRIDRGWHCKLRYGGNDLNVTMEFDYVLEREPRLHKYGYWGNSFTISNGTCTYHSNDSWEENGQNHHRNVTLTFSFFALKEYATEKDGIPIVHPASNDIRIEPGTITTLTIDSSKEGRKTFDYHWDYESLGHIYVYFKPPQ